MRQDPATQPRHTAPPHSPATHSHSADDPPATQILLFAISRLTVVNEQEPALLPVAVPLSWKGGPGPAHRV